MRRHFSHILIGLLVFAFAAPGFAEPETDWNFNLRFRWEVTETPTPSTTREQDFDFGHLRARIGYDAKWDRWSFHALAQAAGTGGLPADGGFGIGRVYFGANGESDPSHAGLAELDLTYKSDDFQLRLGRQKWADGGETKPGVPYLDGVKNARLAQRLIGNWDWVNVGRRFDGLTFGWANDDVHVAGFGLIPLAGGVNYDDAFEQLDDVRVFGLTVTGRYGQMISNGEWRLFDIEYSDERPGAFSATGGEIDIRTLGASLLFGNEDRDFLLWLAFQDGDWGLAGHEAWAYVAEIGRAFETSGGKLAARLGLAEASGDSAPGSGDHETFFNVLPTNHKWYGSIDYSAFQNLRNIYADLKFSRGPLKIGLGLHHFELAEPADAWYGGSGAFNEAALGFAARRPAAGFSDTSLANEIDLSFGWQVGGSGVQLDWGLSYFDGDTAAGEVLTADADGYWGFIQAVWKK